MRRIIVFVVEIFLLWVPVFLAVYGFRSGYIPEDQGWKLFFLDMPTYLAGASFGLYVSAMLAYVREGKILRNLWFVIVFHSTSVVYFPILFIRSSWFPINPDNAGGIGLFLFVVALAMKVWQQFFIKRD